MAFCLVSGCSVSHAHKGVAPLDTPREVVADWDDVDAAVEVALHHVQMAKDHEEVSPDELERRYYLVTITDEPALLTLRRKDIEDGPQMIMLEASVGRFGDPGREAGLVRAVRHRLKALAGVTHAPVTSP
jgi:hypothetical protein